jgi:hydrogenase maturation factor
MSRLYRVRQVLDAKTLEVEDTEGTLSRASLLAFDGAPPNPGEWVIAHSGYVLERVDQDEGDQVAAQIREGLALISTLNEVDFA